MTTEDLIALLKKHPISVACGLVTIICGVLLYLRSGNIAASQTELEASSAQAKKMIANVRNSNGLDDQLAEIQALSKEMEGRLMKAGQLAVNLQYFYKLETENEVKLLDVRQNTFPRNIKTAYAGVPFSVSVQGKHTHVMNFLNRLQNGRHFCRVNTANFSKAGEGNGEITLALNLELLGQP
jgi:Tfp pilus assembly protein PilO